MKRSILSTIILALTASVELAEACGQFYYCGCQQADGSPNNNATVDACTTLLNNVNGQGDQVATYITTSANGTTWCSAEKIRQRWFVPDDCNMHDACVAANATGSNALCQQDWPGW
ncbi:hypothetical protein LZ32DRAFT_612070 [Colletotrichum eremochloae]|nr:hypothetical protein LZ32DRAFT_612070 [Colletotrichum eremochloae]